MASRALVTLELLTGTAGLAGGLLLAAAPDGSMLRADPDVLAGSPFSDWRMPGVLLAGLVGGGFLLAGWWQWQGRGAARELSMAAGAGLICFEAAELAWIGFQPLEAVFAAVGVVVLGLAWRLPATRNTRWCRISPGDGTPRPVAPGNPGAGGARADPSRPSRGPSPLSGGLDRAAC